MPEGPEIRREADQVADAIAGKMAHEVFFAFDHLKPYEDVLTGVVVSRVTSRGKAMLIYFANGYAIYSHNQLYGRWMVRSAYDYPETRRQLRLAIHNEKRSALLYSASEIEVLCEGELDEHPFLRKLGPDVLAETVTAVQVAARYEAPEFRRRQLAALLLDQGFMAGLGNYLRSEICFVARVHPRQRPLDCTPEQIQHLGQATLELARQSYATEGITNDLALVDKLKAQGYKRRDYRFWVFGRQDKPCYVCGTPIVKEPIGSRRCYYCPTCQPPG